MTDDAFLQFLHAHRFHLCHTKPNFMKRNITLLAVAALLFSCKENKEPVTETPEEPAKMYAQLEKAEWLLGFWGNTSPEGNLTENWEKTNDSVYAGHTYFVIGKDTVFTESITLEEANGKLAYVAAVSDQNGGKAIRFEMTSGTENQLVFENPKHDFPQKITYNKITNDSLVAEISGIKDGKPSTEQFAMKKQ